MKTSSITAGVSMKPCSRRRLKPHTAAHTHKIRDHEGHWIWRGDEGRMRLNFANLSGVNFENRPSWSTLEHPSYLATMRHLTAAAWPQRGDPYQAGQFIELAAIGGRSIDSFRFDAPCCTGREQGGA